MLAHEKEHAASFSAHREVILNFWNAPVKQRSEAPLLSALLCSYWITDTQQQPILPLEIAGKRRLDVEVDQIDRAAEEIADLDLGGDVLARRQSRHREIHVGIRVHLALGGRAEDENLARSGRAQDLGAAFQQLPEVFGWPLARHRCDLHGRQG